MLPDFCSTSPLSSPRSVFLNKSFGLKRKMGKAKAVSGLYSSQVRATEADFARSRTKWNCRGGASKCESLGFALSLFVQANLVAPMLEELGSAAQKRKFLSPLLRGEKLGAVAVSEPSRDRTLLRCKPKLRKREPGGDSMAPKPTSQMRQSPVPDCRCAYRPCGRAFKG